VKPQTPSTDQHTARDYSHCVFCGASGVPMFPHDVRTDRPGYAWILGAKCIDVRACAERACARDAHMDERFTLTAAGRALALELVGEQLPLPAA
jgi:hypothetical protein